MKNIVDVFLHHSALPDLGEVRFCLDNEEVLTEIKALYERETGHKLSAVNTTAAEQTLKHIHIKKHFEIQIYHVQLHMDSLKELLNEMLPQFVWTGISEELEDDFATYYCEFIPVAIDGDKNPLLFNLEASVQQQGFIMSTLSHDLAQDLSKMISQEGSSEGIQIEYELDLDPAEESYEVIEAEPVDVVPQTSREDKDLIYLKESLKRERAAKERLRVAKEKLEIELSNAELSMLASGLDRFEQAEDLDEEDNYKTVKLDLMKYDELYRKARFIEHSWKMNRELVTISERMTIRKDEFIYERARVERVKKSVSEIELQSMMEQCHVINNRVTIRKGFLFFKPVVKMYRVDYEQLEKISAFFDIIQNENRLLESVIDQKPLND